MFIHFLKHLLQLAGEHKVIFITDEHPTRKANAVMLEVYEYTEKIELFFDPA